MLDSLEARLDDVRTLCELRGIDPSSAEHRLTLQRIDTRLTELEEAMSAARSAVAQEAEAASAARTLLIDAQRMASEIATHAPLVPAYLEDAAPPPAEPERPALEARSAIPQPSSAAPAPPRGKRIALVTDAELSGAPSYMAGRLTLDKLNALVNELSDIASKKYALLAKPPKSLSQEERRRRDAFKALEDDTTKGTRFLTEADLASCAAAGQGATAKNLLMTLRHLGRLKEFKHSTRGQRCFLLL